MRRLSRLFVLFALSVLLAACGGGPHREINPPRASVQEIAVLANGQWRVSVRLQNFSNVATTFAEIDAALTVGGQDAGRVQLQPALTVGPSSAEVVTLTLAPPAGAKTAVATALGAGRSVRYHLDGRIATSEPRGKHPFEYDSALSPVPGLAGVLR
jgi:hypothetical protein